MVVWGVVSVWCGGGRRLGCPIHPNAPDRSQGFFQAVWAAGAPPVFLVAAGQLHVDQKVRACCVWNGEVGDGPLQDRKGRTAVRSRFSVRRRGTENGAAIARMQDAERSLWQALQEALTAPSTPPSCSPPSPSSIRAGRWDFDVDQPSALQKRRFAKGFAAGGQAPAADACLLQCLHGHHLRSASGGRRRS